MDPQELDRIAGNIGKILDQGGPESDVLAYLQSEGFPSREAWLEAYRAPVQHPQGGPTIGPAGPTAQPSFPTLSPLAGGALDALIAYGTGLTFGLANKIPGVAEANAEIAQRNPRTSMALKGAGAAMSIPVGLMGATAARGAGGLGLGLLRNRAVQFLGASGTGAALYQKLFGGN